MMLFYKLSIGVLLLSTLNIVSADEDADDKTEYSSSPCLQFAQTCVDLCMTRDSVKSFSSSCAVEASSCKCDGEELASKVFKNLIELNDNINPSDMKLQVEEKDANVASMRMLNLVLEDDVNYDEMGQEDDYASQIPKVNSSEDAILEEIKHKEGLSTEKKKEIKGFAEETDYNSVKGAMYLEYDTPKHFDLEAKDNILEDDEGPEDEASIFCPVFIKRCGDDCPAARSRSSCLVSESGLGYILECDCNGVDISSSVRKQVLAEVFHSPASL